MEKTTYKISQYKNVTVNTFQGKVYYHFFDSKKNKTISFTYDEFNIIVTKGQKLINAGNRLMKLTQKEPLYQNSTDDSDSDKSDILIKEPSETKAVKPHISKKRKPNEQIL